jgi:hypothetical protein
MIKKVEASPTKKHVKPDGLAANDKKRTAEVRKKLTLAMVKIRAEVMQAEMIYPENKGRLTQAEVCRRAGIRNVVLRGKQHITTTKVTVDEFVAEMQGLLLGTGKSAKRIITSRADDWKERHGKIAQAYHIDHLRLEAALKEIKRLEVENAKLRAQIDSLSNSNIRNFPTQKRKPE